MQKKKSLTVIEKKNKFIAKIASDNSFNKALNMVLLKELSMITESDLGELMKSARQLQEENLSLTHEVFSDLASQIYRGSAPSYVEDFLK